MQVMYSFLTNLALLISKLLFGSAFSLTTTLAILWPSFLLLFLPPLIARHLLSGLGAGQELAEKLQCCKKREEGKDRS